MRSQISYSYYDLLRYLQYGDIVVVIDSFYHHYAVYIGSGRVVQIRKFGKTQITSLQDCLYARGKLREAYIERIQNPDYCGVASRIEEVLNKQDQYDLPLNNCEHLTRYIVAGKKESRQVQGWVAVAACLALLICAK